MGADQKSSPRGREAYGGGLDPLDCSGPMNLPRHGLHVCVGVDLNGLREPCTEPVDPESSFPFCPLHLHTIQTMPRKRTCAGATTYDHVMRPQKTDCQNTTANEGTRLCPSCLALEQREANRAQGAFQEECPTCGSRKPRAQVHQRTVTPPRYPDSAPAQSRTYESTGVPEPNGQRVKRST